MLQAFRDYKHEKEYNQIQQQGISEKRDLVTEKGVVKRTQSLTLW